MQKKLNLHWFCTQNHILEPFSIRRACTKSYVTSEPYPRASQIWCQNVQETWKKKVIKCRGESFARCRVIARNVEGGAFRPPPPVFLGLNLPKLVLKYKPTLYHGFITNSVLFCTLFTSLTWSRNYSRFICGCCTASVCCKLATYHFIMVLLLSSLYYYYPIQVYLWVPKQRARVGTCHFLGCWWHHDGLPNQAQGVLRQGGVLHVQGPPPGE